MGIASPSKRLEAMPPYMFQELERRIADKRAAGIDVISLGIGDPDEPTYPHIVSAMQEAVADPATHQYPSNRGRDDFRAAFARFYDQRFGVEIDPESEVIPAIGAKECIYNLCFAFLDPGGVALASDPGYPVYTGGPILAGATPELLPLVPELGFAPDLTAVPPEIAAKARLMFLNYPNNPTGAIVPEGFFEMVVSFAEEHEILVVHDNAYSETTYDGYVAPSFLATPGAKEVGVEVFSLSKGYNMTGWRCAAILGNAEAVQTYWRLKTNVDSGLFAALPVGRRGSPPGPLRAAGTDERDLRPPSRPGRLGAARDRRRGQRAEGHDLRLGPRPRGPHLDLLRRAGARRGGGRGLARLDVRAKRRGLLPHRPHHPRRPHHRGRRADARAPGVAARHPRSTDSLLLDLDFGDHAFEGVGRAALAVADEAEEGVAAGLEVERHQLVFPPFDHSGALDAFCLDRRFAFFGFDRPLDVGRGGIAFQRRRDQVMGLFAVIDEVDLDLTGGQFFGFEVVVHRGHRPIALADLGVGLTAGHFGRGQRVGFRRSSAFGVGGVVGARRQHLRHRRALPGRERANAAGREEPVRERLAPARFSLPLAALLRRLGG